MAVKVRKNGVESLVAVYFRKHGSGAQIDIFDLAKVTKAGVDAAKAGESVEAAVIVAIAKYRVN